MKEFFVMENLEFFFVSFDTHFPIWIFSPDGSAVGFAHVQRFDIGAGLECSRHDYGFWSYHVEYQRNSVEYETELFPEVPRKRRFRASAKDEDSDCGSVDISFS